MIALPLPGTSTKSTAEAHVVRSEWSMMKRVWMLALALLFASGVDVATQDSVTNSGSGSWSGIIMNSGCTADEAFAEAAKCTAKMPGAKLVLYDDTSRQTYDLDPQAQAVGHLGDSVTVQGALDGSTIHVSTLKLFAPVGLPVGQKAPAFSARDQFGREQTLESLEGPKGTVLLFFRSADW
jgi:hypothetical protein